MDEFEKVEKLRNRADVSYEEAREALREADGDLLDAMVILEKSGKVKTEEAAGRGKAIEAEVIESNSVYGSRSYGSTGEGRTYEGRAYEERTYEGRGYEDRAYEARGYEGRYDDYERRDSNRTFFRKLSKVMGVLWQKGQDNAFVIEKPEKDPFEIPLWVAVIAVLIAWEILIPILVILLFFGYRYSIQGKDRMDGVNSAMDKAGRMADKMKDEWDKM